MLSLLWSWSLIPGWGTKIPQPSSVAKKKKQTNKLESKKLTIDPKKQVLERSVCVYMYVCCAVLSRFSRVQLFAAQWTIACQASLSVEFSREEYWSGLPCPPPGDLPEPGIEPASLMSPALAVRFFTTSTTWEAPYICIYIYNVYVLKLRLWMYTCKVK